MLQALVRLYQDQQAMLSVTAAPQAVPVSVGEPTPLALPASADSDYARTLGTVLALIACHSGTVDDNCAGIAIDLLTAEEADTPEALAAFEEAIEALTQEAARSATFLKLRQAKLMAGLSVLTPTQQEQAFIMAEAVGEQAAGGASTEVFGRIRQRLNA